MIRKAIISLILSATAFFSCSNRLVDNPDTPLSLFNFRNDLYVASISPSNGQVDVPVSTTIQATFSKEITFSSITGKTFVVADDAYIPITGTYSYDAAAKTVTFCPTAVLSNLTEYNVLITTDVTDMDGNRMTGESFWYFTTILTGTVPNPTFTPAAGTYEGTQYIVLDCTEPSATIRYTLDGSDPSNSHGIVYSGPITVDVNTANPVKAIAYRAGYTDSSITPASYFIQVMTPTISPAAGTYSASQTLSLSTATPGAEIYYTINGVDPTTSDFNYSLTGPFPVAVTTTVKAIATKPFMTDSPILIAPYTINLLQVAPPVFSPVPGSYTSSFTVSMTSATPGAVIRYTTDGSTPTSVYGTIGTSVTVSDTMTLKAIAYFGGMTDSPVATGVYVIAPKLVLIQPSKGPNTAPISVTITGANFKPGATTKLTLSGQPDIVGQSLTVVSSSSITCTFDITGAYETKWDVVVTNTDGGSSVNVRSFRIY